jgi:carbamoyltransferase
MIILGINTFGENPSATLLIDGKLVSFSHEERFNRLKGSYGLFPSHAINWCLKSNNLILADVDYIACSWDSNKYPFSRAKSLIKVKLNYLFQKGYRFPSSIGESSSYGSIFEYLNLYSPKFMKEKIKDNLRISGHKGDIPQIVFVNHHLSHAYQTYFQSSFNESLVLVVDGHGEENCISGYRVNNGVFHKILNYEVPYSLGWFYGGFTAYLGFQANRDEGKMMGLAAYGEVRKKNNPWLERLEKIISFKNNNFTIDPLFFKMGGNEYHPRYTDHLVKFITSFDSEMLPIGLNETVEQNGKIINKYLLDKYVDLAFAVQKYLEDSLISITNKMIKDTGITNLCIAGGVAMNCKANREILDNTDIENIFIHPASSDDGSAIGSAFYVAKQRGYNVRNILTNVQLGASFTNDEIKKALDNSHISYIKSNDIGTDGAKLLNNGKIISWFQDGFEMGARALGGRSIIASPIYKDMKDKVNKNVKYREIWRPYTPSILEEYQDEYIENSVDSPFMILAAKAKKKLIDNTPAVVHIDNTIRPQTVKNKFLPKWYNLINQHYKLSNHPILLNTSFNVRGEPIVSTPYDAIRTFYSTGLDNLIIGDFIISKERI